jgi:hypothetical protein
MSIQCYRCGQEIEHDQLFAPLAFKCPECGILLETDAPPLIASPAVSTRLDNEDQTFKQNSITICRAVLRSGTVLDITHFVLYPEDIISLIRRSIAEAERQCAGFSSGLGFWGSPLWVLGGAIVLGSVESAVTENMHASGLQVIKQVMHLKEQLLQKAEPFSIQNICNVDRVDPSRWVAGYTRYALQPTAGFLKSNKGYKLSSSTRFFAHHGEPYVSVISSDGRRIHVLWENVEQYEIYSEET